MNDTFNTGPMSPLGFPFKRGQKWKEVDPRFDRVVTITGWMPLAGKVQLNSRTWARISRFNGKRSGYQPLEQTKP